MYVIFNHRKQHSCYCTLQSESIHFSLDIALYIKTDE